MTFALAHLTLPFFICSLSSIPCLKGCQFYVSSHTMASPTQTRSPQKLTIILLLFFFCTISFSFPTEATSSEKLDQPVVTQPTDTEVKCGSCPCGNLCGQQLPPPPLPPPPPKSPNSENCNPLPPPPPPPPRFIYVTGVPGNVYQTDPYNWGYYYSAAQNRAVGFLLLAALTLLSITVVFGLSREAKLVFFE